MHTDARQLPTGSHVEADVCIIGAGAAGITLARELAGATMRICLLESGGFEPDTTTQQLSDMINLGRPYPATAGLRCLGGAANAWGGHCVPMRSLNLEKLPWSPYSGWPFGLGELEPYYRRAHDLLQLGPFDYDPARAAALTRTALLPFDPARVETVVSRYRRLQFGAAYRDELVKASSIVLYTHANVTSVNRATDGDHVETVTVRTIAGSAFTVRAETYVLATGGIENARILLASHGVQRAGLGNQHDLVGRFFTEHIWYPSGVIVPTAPEAPRSGYADEVALSAAQNLRFHVALPEQVVRDAAIPDFRTELQIVKTHRYADSVMALAALREDVRRSRWPQHAARHLRTIVTQPGAIARFLMNSQGPAVYRLQNFSEQAPNPDSRIALSGERDALGMNRATVDWRLSSIDRDGILKAHQLIAAEVRRSGFGHMKIEMEIDEAELLPGACGGSHHMGTTRMHDNPRRGVVDANCRIHGLHNIYVAGSSVFPTAGYANPTLTLVALAIRLADHLRQVMARVGAVSRSFDKLQPLSCR